MPFNQVTLPNRTEEQLSTYIRGSGLPGGVFLLHGTSDHNRWNTADLLARYFLCTGTHDPSCPCPSCRVFGSEHPDLFSMELSEAGNLLVGTVREALDFLTDFSTVSDRRCLLIKRAEKLTPSAEASLLKVLEEDPDGVLVILTCRDRRDISSTIMSRTKMFFTGDSSCTTYQPLMMKAGMKIKKAEELSKLSPFLSIDPMDNADTVTKAHETAPQLFTYILRGDTCKALAKFSGFVNQSNALGAKVLAEVMVAMCTDFLKVKFMDTLHVSMPSRTSWYLEHAGSHSESDINRCLNAFAKVMATHEKQARAMFIWAVGITSLLIRADIERGRKEREG